MLNEPDITALLSAAKLGDSKAEEQLFSLLYADLRRLAHQRLKRSKPCTLLETTALVHEAYLRLNRAGYVQISDRSHFLAYAARAMRSIVVDFVRRSGAARKEGSGDISGIADPVSGGASEILRVDRALEELAAVSDRLVKVVEMRYFAGMKETEIAEALSLTERTVRRDWDKARMLLAEALK
ncbi:MAG TPA: ECF-type sigma factor [Verrucomicrobiae bacterium]|nr:ECF-type sigma factor [Verrucomicrobiae bacterium]